jgi:hypothetical protein
VLSPPKLSPVTPLSQVVFVHDYVQLVFGGERFSIYNEVSVARTARVGRSGESAFADALVSLIGQTAVSVAPPSGARLALAFEQGALLVVAGGGTSAEAFSFEGGPGVIVVEGNDA